MAKVPDTTHNIQVIINNMKEQTDELAPMKWKDIKIKLFVFGDYWFLCKLYGCPQGHTHVYGVMSNMKCRTMISRHLNLETSSHLEMII